jgi:multiple sugar transport system ATP-binding protein
MAEIRFEKVGKKFGAFRVIRDLSLTIGDGEFFTFVGPSGCGKSTVLNMVAGLEPVTEGNIYFDDSVVNDLSPSDRDVAMVFQSYALYPHMTVYENIAFPLKMKMVKKDFIDSEVRRVADLLGIGQLTSRKPKDLSGGQRQRVALGRAIIRRPKVFLMDEPLSNLDASLRLETRAELKGLHRELKITTVYVTHDQAEALSLSDRIAVLAGGDIQQVGTPLNVYRRPANVFVARFIGSSPMNMLPGRVLSSSPFVIDCNGMTLQAAVENIPEGPVLVGIRPEEIRISRERMSDEDRAVSIVLTETAGSFDWVEFSWGGVSIKGISAPDSGLAAGDTGFMNFFRDKIVIFDENSGLRL